MCLIHEILMVFWGGVCLFMTLTVQKKKGESKEELISRFRKLFLEAGIMDKIKEKTAYVKPSRRRYEKKKALEGQPKRDGE